MGKIILNTFPGFEPTYYRLEEYGIDHMATTAGNRRLKFFILLKLFSIIFKRNNNSVGKRPTDFDGIRTLILPPERPWPRPLAHKSWPFIREILKIKIFSF